MPLIEKKRKRYYDEITSGLIIEREFHPSQKLLKEVRINKMEGLLLGIFFTSLSVVLALLSSLIFYLYFSLFLFVLNLFSLVIFIIVTEQRFHQDYLITNSQVMRIRNGKIIMSILFDQISAPFIIHIIRGNVDSYSLFFLPKGYSYKYNKLSNPSLPLYWDDFIKGVSKDEDYNGKLKLNRFSLRKFALPYLDLEQAITIREDYLKLNRDIGAFLFSKSTF